MYERDIQRMSLASRVQLDSAFASKTEELGGSKTCLTVGGTDAALRLWLWGRLLHSALLVSSLWMSCMTRMTADISDTHDQTLISGKHRYPLRTSSPPPQPAVVLCAPCALNLLAGIVATALASLCELGRVMGFRSLFNGLGQGEHTRVLQHTLGLGFCQQNQAVMLDQRNVCRFNRQQTVSARPRTLPASTPIWTGAAVLFGSTARSTIR